MKLLGSLYQIFNRCESIRQKEVVAPIIRVYIAEYFASCKEWYLGGNQMAHLDNKPFEGLTSLEILGLYNNQLAHLDNKPFEGLTSLKELYLDNNQLAHLDNKPFQGLNNLTVLQLFSNKLNLFWWLFI